MSLILDGTNGLSDVDGSAGTPAIRGSDTNTGIFFDADIIGFSEGGTECARFNADAQFVAAAGTASLPVITTTGDVNTGIFFPAADTIAFAEGGAEAMRIDSSGNLLVGTTSAFNSKNTIISSTAATGALQLTVAGSGSVPGVSFHWANNTGTANAANSQMKLGLMGVTSKSISAAGTINASGADYAEYMTKAGDFAVAKGAVIGINADGKLTNVFAEAVSFVVKSTDPSYVGGDVWGSEDAIGPYPADDATDEEKAAYADALEVARQKVDRIAFAGQVPVNVMGATPGQYIVPADDAGVIKGVAKNESDMTLTDYMQAVGKVIAVESDGRAKIIVKVA